MYIVNRIFRETGRKTLICICDSFDCVVYAIDHDQDDYTFDGLCTVKYEISFAPLDMCDGFAAKL